MRCEKWFGEEFHEQTGLLGQRCPRGAGGAVRRAPSPSFPRRGTDCVAPGVQAHGPNNGSEGIKGSENARGVAARLPCPFKSFAIFPDSNF